MSYRIRHEGRRFKCHSFVLSNAPGHFFSLLFRTRERSDSFEIPCSNGPTLHGYTCADALVPKLALFPHEYGAHYQELNQSGTFSFTAGYSCTQGSTQPSNAEPWPSALSPPSKPNPKYKSSWQQTLLSAACSTMKPTKLGFLLGLSLLCSLSPPVLSGVERLANYLCKDYNGMRTVKTEGKFQGQS
jgi:hypothetical protein